MKEDRRSFYYKEILKNCKYTNRLFFQYKSFKLNKKKYTDPIQNANKQIIDIK